MDDSELDFGPRYNLAPGTQIVVAREGHPISYMLWGLIPSWAKEKNIAYKMFNARSETLLEKPSFRSAFKSRRCVIPVDGFYEWQRVGKEKRPSFIHRTDKAPIYLAGLWETWNSPGNKLIETATVITREADETIRPIHDRMPVILSKNDIPLWFSAPASSDIFSKFEPASNLVLTPVSPRMNSVRVDDEECIQELSSAA